MMRKISLETFYEFQMENEFQIYFKSRKSQLNWRNAFRFFWLNSVLYNVMINSVKVCLKYEQKGAFRDFPKRHKNFCSRLPRRRSRCVARYTCLSFWICWLILLLASLRCLLSSASDLEALRPKQPMTVDQASECAGGCESGSVPPTA